MLQTQAVEPRTLELLRELQKEPLMSSFNLVGGTALALFFFDNTRRPEPARHKQNSLPLRVLPL